MLGDIQCAILAFTYILVCRGRLIVLWKYVDLPRRYFQNFYVDVYLLDCNDILGRYLRFGRT